ncbi:MAG: hypothetical protein NVSMB52_00950 [Chloroflexota bacterium]
MLKLNHLCYTVPVVAQNCRLDLMLRFKLFSGSGADLESDVNAWLAQLEPDVTQMVQTAQDDGSVTLGFLFEESFRAQEVRMDEERGMSGRIFPAVPATSIPDDPITVPMEPGMPMDSSPGRN